MDEQVRWIAEVAGDGLSDQEVLEEYRAIRPALMAMVEDWKRLRDANRGCPVMRHLLDG